MADRGARSAKIACPQRLVVLAALTRQQQGRRRQQFELNRHGVDGGLLFGLERAVHRRLASEATCADMLLSTIVAGLAIPWTGLAAHKSCATGNGAICISAHQARSLPWRCRSR